MTLHAVAGLHAGAGRAVITAPSYPLDGFDGEHDPLQARVLLLTAGPDRAAIAVLDQTSVHASLVTSLRDTVAAAAHLDPGNVLVCVSHTFSAPHVSPEAAAPLIDAVARAAARAEQTLEPARIGYGHGTCHVNINRDVRTADGWWLGASETGVTDRSVAVVRIDDRWGHPIAIGMNYAVQSSVMNESVTTEGERLVSADLAGAAVAYVEDQYGDDTVALFLLGAAGDQGPYLSANRYLLDADQGWSRADVHESGHLLVDLLGERLGSEVVRVAKGLACTASPDLVRVVHDTVTVQAQQAPASFRDLKPVTHYDFRPEGTATVPITILRMGEIALAGVQPELNAVTGLDIKNRSPLDATLVLTMVNGGAKYMADSASYDRITYEAMNSHYAQGSAEIVANRIIELLEAP